MNKKCATEKYDPKQFGMISRWLMRNDWSSRIVERYTKDDAKALLDAITHGYFTPSYGKTDIKAILTNTNPLSRAKDVTNLKSHYITMKVGRTGGDFDRMKKDFQLGLIERVLLDKDTYRRIETDKELNDGITILNHNLYDYKIELIKELWTALYTNKFEYTYDGKNGFTKLINSVLSEYEGRRLTNPKLDSLWNTYFKLAFFDELLSDFNSFVDLKPEFKTSALKSMDMYISVQPYVRYDTSFNPNEFATADQYASEVLKTLLEYFKEYQSDGTPGNDPIGFKGYNFAVTRLCEWVNQQDNIVLKDELDKGNNTDWNLLINNYISSKNAETETIKKLKGIQAVFSFGSLDSTIREMLNEQRERVIRYQFESYRFMWDPGLRRNVLVPLRVEDSITDRQKGVIAKSVRTKVNRFRKNPLELQEFLEDHEITYNSKTKEFTFKHFLKGNSRDLIIQVEPHSEKTYIFNRKNGIVGEDVDQQKVRDLVNDLFGYYITDDLESIFNTSGFNGHNMWDTWDFVIMRTLTASFTGDDNFPDYTYRKNGIELEFKGTSYSELAIPAAFLSIMNGFSKITVAKNGLGNDLPIYQQISAIHKANEILRKALSNFEEVRSGNHNELSTRDVIYEDSILRPNKYGYSPIGAVFVRSDYDYDGINKTSAQMNFKELTHLAVLKSFYHNLYHNDGKITLQTTCLSDKHTHFMVQFLTSRIFFNDSFGQEINLQTALINAASLNENDRKYYSELLLNEIKNRRNSKTKIEVVNLYNRYALIPELGLIADATKNMSYDELKARLDNLNLALNKYSNRQTVYDLCKDANDSNGVDYLKEADLIELGGKVYINETLYNNFLDYCNPNSTRFRSRMEEQMLLHAKFMFDNHFVLDGNLDPDILRIINSFKASDIAHNTDETKNWVDLESNVVKPFRLFKKVISKDGKISKGEEIIPTYISKDYDSQFDSNLVIVELNPVLNSHFYADVLLSNAFNDIVFGEDYGVDGKAIKKINKELNKVEKLKNEALAELEINQKLFLSITDWEEKTEIQNKINQLRGQLKNIDEVLKKWDYSSPTLRRIMEASRLNMHYKRTVHGGATYTPFLQNLKWGVAPKVKIAVVEDIKDPLFSITGDIDKFTSQDGSGFSSPYFSRMANKSFVDGAVGRNKKTIFSYVDPETGVLTLIKWAEYEITNAVRRDSPPDNEHSSMELMFKKMHSFDISDKIDWNNFDITKYYNRKGGVPGITTTKAIYKRVYDTKTNTIKHFLLSRIENSGQEFTPIWQEVDERGEAIFGKSPERGETVFIKNLYELDQLFGGAYVEEKNQNGWLDWSERQNDIIYNIICDNDLKDSFIGYTINESAVKSGMRNNNPSNAFYKTNLEELLWSEISTRYGGAQMNADHILSEAEVTEMSQMISALIQAGLKTGTVDKVYAFIGRVAAESLGNLSTWINSADDELKVYKWLGEAVSRSLNSGQSDTLGLAGAFINRANRSLRDNGLKTKIPFSANTIKGIFEASVTAFINSRAIHRTFPGGGFVQNPTYDIKPRYGFGDNSYSFTELSEILLDYNKRHNTSYTADFVINDRSCFRNPNSNLIVFNNPFIKELTSDQKSTLDIGDTIIVWKDSDLDQSEKLSDNMRVVTLNEFTKYDYYRNLYDGHVAKWETRPKNLRGSRTFMKVNGVQKSLYDLDSVRASIYCSILLDGKIELFSEAINFLNEYINKHSEILLHVKDDDLTLNNESLIQLTKQYANWQTKEDLKRLSKIQQNGSGEDVFSFNNNNANVYISDINTESSEILIGVADAKAFGIEKTSDFQLIEKQKEAFFRSRMQNLTQKPSIKSVDKNKYDIVAHKSDGSITLVLIGELRDTQTDLSGLTPNLDYIYGEDGHLYYNNEDLGDSFGKMFYKYVGEDGIEYEVLYCDTLKDFETFNRENQLYSNTIDNYNINNVKFFSKLRTGQFNFNFAELNEKELEKQQARLNLLAKKRYAAWEAYKKGIATRIPAQSMQSFTSVKVVGFTNDDVTNVYISTMLAFLQGSDFDIDKLYIMRYGVTDDGRIATFSNLDNIFNPEKCLDLPVPKGRTFNVIRGNRAKYESLSFKPDAYFEIQQGGLKTIQKILEESPNITNRPIEIFINDTNAIVGNVLLDFDRDALNPLGLNYIDESTWEKWLNTHEQSKRTGSTKQIALRNVVVRGILDVITDASTQYNLQIPISMDQQRNAAEKSQMGAEESILTSDNPSAKIMMQIQNMVGRDVIGIGAASLKAFFAASTYFNKNVSNLTQLLKNKNKGINNNHEIFNIIKNLVFNGKFKKRGLITFANINYTPVLEALENVNSIVITEDDYKSLKEGINDNLKKYIDKSPSGEYVLRLEELLEDLNKAANGSWLNPIDAAFSLSGLISAATDNAKELILAKINATSKLADLYTYLLSIGEKFEDIADFIMGPEFKVVIDFVEGNMLDPSTNWFNLENSLKFVLDQETLPNISNTVFEGLLTSQEPSFNLLNIIFRSSTIDNDWYDRFKTEVARNDVQFSISNVEEYVKSIIKDERANKNNGEHTEAYQRLLNFIYSALKEDLSLDTALASLIKENVISSKPIFRTEDFDPDAATYEESFDDDFYQDVQEDEFVRSKATYFNIYSLKNADWINLYRYVTMYLIPKNQKLIGINDLSKLKLLQDAILPALKEQRMLSKILGINKGLETKDFDEYKWIRDIEAFVNDRFINNTKQSFEEFNLLLFLDPKEKEYHDKMIKYYEDVKSTYNILAIIDSAEQFKAMLERARDNRLLIEKAYILKVERKMADVILRANKQIKNGLSQGLTQKLREKEFQVLKTFAQDIITANWLSTLTDVSIKLPYNRTSPVKYFDNGSELVFNPGNIFESMDRDELLDFAEQQDINLIDLDNMSDEDIREILISEMIDLNVPIANDEKEVFLNNMDGMATFKWMMEHYIIPKLKKIENNRIKSNKDYKPNSFILSLQLSNKFDELTQKEIEFYCLPMDLGNSDNNSEAENTYNMYLADFNRIWDEYVPDELGISSENNQWTIGDLFYLYNLYVNKDGFGRNSLTRIFDNVVLSNDDNTLLYRYYDYICRLDSQIDHIEDVENLDVSQADGSSDNLLTEIRCALAGQNGAKSRFRTEISKENDVPTEYVFYDQDYNEQRRWPINRLDKNYYLFPFVANYNPIKINDTSEHARELNNRNARSFKVGGKEALETIIRAFQDTFGEIVPIVTIDNSWFAKNNIINKNLTRTAKGFIYNGTIYINVDNADLGTPIHELMHVLFAALKYGSTNQRALYYKLLRETSDLYQSLDGVWRKFANNIRDAYKDVAVGSDLQEEVLVHIFSDIFSSGYISAMGVVTKDDEVTETYRELQKQIYKAIEDVFKVKLPEMKSSKLNQTIMNMSLSQLLVDFSSNLFNFNGNLITRTFIPYNQKIAKFKKDAFDNAGETSVNMIWDDEKEDWVWPNEVKGARNDKPQLIFEGDC